MTSLKQLEANRRNALKSSGPKTESGKHTSRCNAVRHGLSAESVIGALEDAEDYNAFEEAVAAGFDAETAVERELVLRLASLLWRLRRAIAIDTGLLETPTEVEKATGLESAAPANEQGTDGISEIRSPENQPSPTDSDDKGQNGTLNSEIARRFLRLDSKCFKQLGRYETALWRQAYQVILVLNVLQRQNLDRSWLPRSSSSTRARFRPFGSLLPKA